MSNGKRPASIFIVSLWSLLRAVLSLGAIYGTFILIENTFIPVDNSFLGLWSVAPLETKLSMISLVIKSIAFFAFTVGIFRGFDWGRRGFIIVSAIFFVWFVIEVGRTLLGGIIPLLSGTMDSLIALCIAFWYFNREDVMVFFGVEERYPNWDWVYFRIGKYPVTLIVAICLGIFRLLTEGVSFIYYNFLFG